MALEQDGIFYACESDNGLARAAGEQAVSFFSEYLGPNIWRGRVEQYHPRSVCRTCKPFENPPVVDAVSKPGT